MELLITNVIPPPEKLETTASDHSGGPGTHAGTHAGTRAGPQGGRPVERIPWAGDPCQPRSGSAQGVLHKTPERDYPFVDYSAGPPGHLAPKDQDHRRIVPRGVAQKEPVRVLQGRVPQTGVLQTRVLQGGVARRQTTDVVGRQRRPDKLGLPGRDKAASAVPSPKTAARGQAARGQAATGQAATGQAATGHAATGHAAMGHAAVSRSQAFPTTNGGHAVGFNASRSPSCGRSPRPLPSPVSPANALPVSAYWSPVPPLAPAGLPSPGVPPVGLPSPALPLLPGQQGVLLTTPEYVQSEHVQSEHVQSEYVQPEYVQRGYAQSGYVPVDYVPSEYVRSPHYVVSPEYVQSPPQYGRSPQYLQSPQQYHHSGYSAFPLYAANGGFEDETVVSSYAVSTQFPPQDAGLRSPPSPPRFSPSRVRPADDLLPPTPTPPTPYTKEPIFHRDPFLLPNS
ncbi:hypothetical protein GNI_005980 [Gregarina niphandrodes]|uniref:Uncharacterized protein n=1 Tax=Gregarina niphandrodes TaxID=110365 RepID=A0A023BDE0_GRENI|nr:hypothetical protein GNI_005980 [Gregarina niphandrodes]EZG87979.1 hypothetical protein GNI_005980 [Gregarina niphandrodes]|eukprot:XP_011128629.1 hypothetical protein GNI_005980 [Gregarina niphandrodes]